jgi:hypothetical protein
MTTRYPDISDILRRKEQGRKDLAALSIEEKIERLERMRERAEVIRKARSTLQLKPARYGG